MKKFDIYFSIFCGLLVAEILRELGYFLSSTLFLVLPIFAVSCFLLAEYISKKYLFVLQASKHVLAGIFATVVDLKIFEFLFSLLGFKLLPKIISYIISAFVKYLFNKFWAFEKRETKISHSEFAKFLSINIVGLAIDVSCFTFLTKHLGPQFGLTIFVWTKISVLISAGMSGIWNFCGDKFVVFKK